MRINICSIKIDRYSFDEVVARIFEHIRSGTDPEYVA